MRKVMLSALAAIALLAAASTQVKRQAAQQPDAADAGVTRNYHSFDGIPLIGPEDVRPFNLLPRPRMLHASSSDWQQRQVVIFPDAAWHSIWRNEVDQPVKVNHLINQILPHSHPETEAEREDYSAGVSVEGTSDDHARMQWILDRLRDYYARRVTFSVLELKQPAPSGVLSADRAGELRKNAWPLANRTVPPREVAIVSTVRSFEYIADYEMNVATSASVPEPVVRPMHEGHEIALSAVPAPDGSLLVRGVRADSRLRTMHTFDGPMMSGVFGQPEYEYAHEEGAVVLKPGEAWVFGDRYLISATVQQSVSAAWCPHGNFALLPADLLVKRETTPLELVPGSYPRFVEFAGPHDEYDLFSEGPAVRHLSTDLDVNLAPTQLTPALERLVRTGATLSLVGPLVCASWEDAVPTRDMPLVESPGTVALQARCWHVSRDTFGLANLLEGDANAAMLSRLGTPLYSRRVSQLEDALVSDASLVMRNYVRSFDTNTATGVAAYDPVVGTMITGTRLAIEIGKVGESTALDISFAYAPEGKVEPSPTPIPEHGRMQTATVASTMMKWRANLKVGETTVQMTPLPESPDKLIVLAISRTQP